MAKELVITWAGRHQRPGWRELCAEFERRISRFVPIRDLPVKLRGRPNDRLEAEREALQKVLPKGAWTIALDRRGRQMSSVQLSRFLVKRLQDWPGPLAFILGSDLGLSRKFVESADYRLSLSLFTLPHELARLVLLEQLYRALAIDRGIKYHREPIERG